MDRKQIAQQTLRILEQGYYKQNGRRVEIKAAHLCSVRESVLIEEADWAGFHTLPGSRQTKIWVANQTAVGALLEFSAQGLKKVDLLNFASAKNSGGGFLNGAIAQEESLAASSGLYKTQTAHPVFYERNRTCRSMVYTLARLSQQAKVCRKRGSGRPPVGIHPALPFDWFARPLRGLPRCACSN